MSERISVDPDNSWYWQYSNERTLLLGATDTDSLFQWANNGLEDHLDLLVSVGGNYVRNTMSDRQNDDQGGDGKKAESVFAFMKRSDGRYDLTQWNNEYWSRLETFLQETNKRDIVVELTLWDQHDLGGDRWNRHPWNPTQNANYDITDSELESRADFFSTVAHENDVVYPFQRRFIQEVLDLSLDYGHIVYNISNEGWAGLEWENKWCDVVRDEAAARDVSVHVANMNMSPRISVDKVIDDPDRYTYVEISQHNQDTMGKTGQDHWDDLLAWRLAIGETVGPRPINNVKIYGAEGGHVHAGDAPEAVDRMWRAVLAGCASARFHRLVGDNNWGIGLNDRGQAAIRSIRMLEEEVNLSNAVPRNDLLLERNPNESYCASLSDGRYVVYFPDGGSAILDLDSHSGDPRVDWIDVRNACWDSDGRVNPADTDKTDGPGMPIEITAPSDGQWTALLSH